MRLPILALCLVLVAATQRAGSVANSFLADGTTVVNHLKLQTAGDRFSGAVLLRGPIYRCSGTLIAPRVVLTAAHCATSAVRAYFIDDSANSWVGGFTAISVSTFVAHPSFNPDQPDPAHDLGIAILSSNAPATARISSFWVNSINKPYSGTIFQGGFGAYRNLSGGYSAPTNQRTLIGTIDGSPASSSLPLFHAGANRLSFPLNTTATATTGTTDFDTWFPARQGVLTDDALVFDYDRQKSPYGYTQQLDAQGHRIFVGGGYIPFPEFIEGVTLPGDSGSSVFYNPKALVESVLWYTSYDDMLALGGVPNDALLGFLKPQYQNDTNYIVGVTSMVWTKDSGCAVGDGTCISQKAMAARGGAHYTLTLPHLPWIQSVLNANAAGTIQTAVVAAGDSSGDYTPFAMYSASLEPLDGEEDLQRLYPDLVVNTLSAPPLRVAPGATFFLQDTTKNQGTWASPATMTRYYVSLDAVKSSGDTRLGGSRTVPALDKNTQSAGGLDVTVPASTPLGTYYLIACADDKKAAAESNESNNCLATGSTVQVARTDLTLAGVQDPPATITPGSKFTVTHTVFNLSVVDAPASSSRFYLSLDSLKNAGDVLLTGSFSVPALASGLTSLGVQQVTVPSNTPLNAYKLLACADDTEKVLESNEANNCKASAGSVLVGLPDLVTTQIGALPPAATIGGKIAMSDTAANQGAVSSVATSTRYYASLDASWSANDTLLTGGRSVPILAPGASSAGSKNVSVPLTTAPGGYYVLACADDTKKTLEASEANNCRASATTVVLAP